MISIFVPQVVGELMSLEDTNEEARGRPEEEIGTGVEQRAALGDELGGDVGRDAPDLNDADQHEEEDAGAEAHAALAKELGGDVRRESLDLNDADQREEEDAGVELHAALAKKHEARDLEDSDQREEEDADVELHAALAPASVIDGEQELPEENDEM